MAVTVDKNLVLNYLESNKENMSLEEISSLAGLFKTYQMIHEAVEGNYEKNKNEVLRYEDYIYNLDGKVLSNKDRIALELRRIKNKIDGNIELSEIQKETLKKELDELIEISSNEKYNEYVKKEISILQSKLGLENTFLSSAYEAFLEKYTIIYEEFKEEDISNKAHKLINDFVLGNLKQGSRR